MNDTGFFESVAQHGLVATVSQFPLTATLLLVLFAVSLFLSVSRKIDVPSWKPAPGLRTPKNHSEADIAKAKDAKLSSVVWQLGITLRSISVCENGVLRLIEFTPNGLPPTDSEIISTIISAILEPINVNEQFEIQRPKLISILESRQCNENIIPKISSHFEQFGIKVAAAEDSHEEISEMRRVWIQEQQQQQPKREYMSTPPRICFVCRNEITKKATQCSACKAVIYCGADCAKKDWQQHKTLCPLWKSTMLHADQNKLFDFPFPYTTPKLFNYNMAIFLGNTGIHNIGIYRRLCHCFDQEPFGELGIASTRDFKDLGVPEEMWPLNKPVKGEMNDWKSCYEAFGVPPASPVSLVLECPLTVYNLIKKFYLPTIPKSKDGEARILNVHMVHCSYEADLIHLFECLVPLFPSTTLNIHMIGPMISQRMDGSDEFTKVFVNNDLKSKVKVTLRHGVYDDSYLVGKGNNMESKPPNLIIALNAPVLGGPGQEYFPWKLIVEGGIKSLLSVTMEAGAKVLEGGMKTRGVNFSHEVAANEFRQPVVQFSQDLNLPGFSNGFIFGFN